MPPKYSDSNPDPSILQAALEGDITAFQQLFVAFQDNLKSYLFRLLASRADAEDLAHDTFIRAFDKLHTFQGNSSLKTWVFTIATNLAYNSLKKRQRWTVDVSQKAKQLVLEQTELAQQIEQVAQTSPYGRYEIQQHIDTCFTCISKTLSLEQQVVLLLRDVYEFGIGDIQQILNKTVGVVKYQLQTSRATMTKVFEQRCALINKEGICHQCSELNGWFNPKQEQQAVKVAAKQLTPSQQAAQADLLSLRTKLIRAIDPLKSSGNELQEILLHCNRMAMGED